MAHGPRYRTGLRRQREGRTDYRRRLKLLKSGKPRAVVRRSLRNTRVQLVAFDPEGDRVLAQAEARELADHGWDCSGSSCPAAYLTGFLAGTRAVEAGVEEAVLDIGDHAPSPGSNIFGALAGLLDAGVDIPHGEQVLPDAYRLRGEHAGGDGGGAGDGGARDAFERVLQALGGQVPEGPPMEEVVVPADEGGDGEDAGEPTAEGGGVEEGGEAPDETPDETPEETPDETPEGTGDEAPEGTDDGSPEEAPEGPLPDSEEE